MFASDLLCLSLGRRSEKRMGFATRHRSPRAGVSPARLGAQPPAYARSHTHGPREQPHGLFLVVENQTRTATTACERVQAGSSKRAAKRLCCAFAARRAESSQ